MPRLTEQEQQAIVRFIEADRPLPEKYRFLLFGNPCGVDNRVNSRRGMELNPSVATTGTVDRQFKICG